MYNFKMDEKIKEIESLMNSPTFWEDKDRAQVLIKELQELKDSKDGLGKYDRGGAVLNIFSGAGGDDAEDFTYLLFNMYQKFISKKGWTTSLLSESKNDHGGYRNVTIEINGKNVYGTLKNESGVHRLVRISPFNSQGKRQTSFSMVEVIPQFNEKTSFDIADDDLNIEFTKSSGPGGQNVNKRETAVRITHLPSKISVFIASERSQAQNRERAMALIKGKVYNMLEEERKMKESGMYISKTSDNEWGSQIRSYVLHPYKLVKDHRTKTEVRDVDAVFDGDLDKLIEANKQM
ncbi:MAG: peptide chain release factor 2 [Candidatus Paceibacteria bacterium]|jgi:peptide chain release factor 2